MSLIVKLPGRTALSDFRVAKLLHQVRAYAREATAIRTQFWHFVKLRRPLSATEGKALSSLLTYGPAFASSQSSEQMLLVVPRLGTISPWSSKASDIAHQCGLEAVERIERGTAYQIEGVEARKLRNSPALLALLHDRMTETVLDSASGAEALFHEARPQPMSTIELTPDARSALMSADRRLGLALSEDEIDYLARYYSEAHRNPTDVELMMFAQANSEHCRHKIFNAQWVIDGQAQTQTLFGMIRHTHAQRPQGTLVAYADNAAVMEGAPVERLYPDASLIYRFRREPAHIVMKVETHNHPTAISPYAGAATGSGGEIRDEAATGRGAKPKAGLTGYSVSHLRIPGFEQPWESNAYGRPARIASALQIMLEGPIGAAAFNNEFGRPNLLGYFRTFEQMASGVCRAYHKPIMLAGGVGNISESQITKQPLRAGTLLVQLGGPGMLIGLGGGSASSMGTGDNTEELDFASVQRANAELERRAQEVIDRCWAAGEANPILSIHDVGAGGLSNALPELTHGGGVGGHFDLRAIPSEEPAMSPMQIWCNEAQERYVLAVDPARISEFTALCKRERCPYAVIGTATENRVLRVDDPVFDNRPVDMELAALLGKPPRMTRDVQHVAPALKALDLSGMHLREAAMRVLRLPAVANKTFLISIGDRTVGGMCSRDPFVGPWQVPVADVAVTVNGFKSYSGEAMAIGERTPLALIDPRASGRMAVGEALTNLAAARVSRERVKLSANWMAAAGHDGEDAALYDTVRSVAIELCPTLGISIPVGKDSMSMKVSWDDNGKSKAAVAPLSLIVSAFAPCEDVRKTLTPQLTTGDEETVLLLVDLGSARNRLGGSALAQVYDRLGDRAPDVDEPSKLAAFFDTVQAMIEAGVLLAYHDRADGGLFVTLCEMMFASHVGVTVEIDSLMLNEGPLPALFNEELGAVLQVRRSDLVNVEKRFAAAGLERELQVLGAINRVGRLIIKSHGEELYSESGIVLQRAWSEMTYHLQRLRDNPQCAQEEFDHILDTSDPGVNVRLTFEPAEDITVPMIAIRARPRIAVLREQGVNGQIEMAAAFERAGFEAVDVHTSDIIAGSISLRDFAALVAPGGFSYGDVLGAGEGWAKSILYNARAREEFTAFFQRSDVFALGVCNGCQMMSNLRSLIPGTEHWPHFVRNRSEQFEGRFVSVRVERTPSLFFAGMEGSVIPIPVAHGEGYAEFKNRAQLDAAQPLITWRYTDNRGVPTELYPLNPNGSPEGVTGLTTADGRFTIVMPHPERVFRTVLNSWHPETWGEDGPWMRMFRNARRWLG
jgi:phosphoribosylformylglycinamidine synthase